MARFYGSIQGSRGEATRLGHQQITAHVRGWDVGCKVEVYIDPAGHDRVDVWTTGGSNDSSRRVLLASYTRETKDKPEQHRQEYRKAG